MLFTNGRLQSFEQIMKQPPHHHHQRPPRKQPESKVTNSSNSLNPKKNNRNHIGENSATPTDTEE